MSNSPAQPESLQEYLAHLPMSEEQRAELASSTSFGELHERLSASGAPAGAEAAHGSVGQRLTLNSAAELEENGMLVLDANGRVRMKATPRSTAPRWFQNPGKPTCWCVCGGA